MNSENLRPNEVDAPFAPATWRLLIEDEPRSGAANMAVDQAIALGKKIADVAKRAFHALGCRDVARIDLRLDATGQPNFIECNPLPGLTPGWSDLCQIATAAGMDYRALVGEILQPAVRRARVAARLRTTRAKSSEK